MSSPLELPTELLARIIALTISDSYEPVMMTCKRIFEAGEIYREKHNRLARRYRHFSFGTDIPSSWELLGAIAEEPQIGEYIQTAYLYKDANWGYPDEEGEAHEVAPIPSSDQRVAAIENLLRHSGHLESVSIHDWLEKMKGVSLSTDVERMDVEDRLLYSTTFLLTLLPNITALALPRAWESFYYDSENLEPLRDVLHNTVRSANENSHGDSSLGKLTNLCPSGHNHGYDERIGLGTFSAFLALPSMRTVTLVSCVASDDCNSGIEYSWAIPGLDSPVNTVELYASIMEGPETDKVLEHMVNLRCFRFSHETKWHGCGHEWHVEQFFDALAKQLGPTLKALSVTITNYFEDLLPSRVATLQNFTQLDDLELDVRILGIPSTDPSIWKVERDADYKFTLDDIPCLADILPPTIKTVKIITGARQDEAAILNKLFTGFEEAAELQLPELESVVVTRGLKGVGSTRCPNMANAKHWPILWTDVRKLLEDQGYVYREVDEARAGWVSDLFQRFPYLDEEYS